jgi:hypothetical protein
VAECLDENLQRLAGILATGGQRPAGEPVDDELLAAFMVGELEPGTPPHDQVLAALAADPVLRRRWLEAARLGEDLSAGTVEAVPVPGESARILPFQRQGKAAGGGGSGSKRGRWLSGLTALAASLLVATIVVRPWMAGPEVPGAAEDNRVRSGIDGSPPAIPYGDALVALAGHGVQALERDAQWTGSPAGPRNLTVPGKTAWIDRFGSADPATAPSTLAAGYAIGIERVAAALAETDPAWKPLAERAQRRAGQGCREAQACEAAAGLGAWALATAIQCRAGLVPGGSEELTVLPALLIDGIPEPWPMEWPMPPLSADRLCPEAERVASLARLGP